MRNNFIYRVAKGKDAGMGLMPEKPCDIGFHGGGGATSKGSTKAFYTDE